MFHAFAAAIYHLSECCCVGVVRDDDRNIHIFIDDFLYVEVAFEIEICRSAEGAFVIIAVRSAYADAVDVLYFVFLHHFLDEVGDVFKINLDVEVFVCRDVTTHNDFTVVANQTNICIGAAYINAY